jgi:hypothetical protein
MKTSQPKDTVKPHSRSPSAAPQRNILLTTKIANVHQRLLTPKPNPTTSKPITTAQGALKKQRHHSFSSSSEDAGTPHQGSQNDYQQIHLTKRKRIFSSQPTPQTPQTITQSQYEMLTEEIPTPD